MAFISASLSFATSGRLPVYLCSRNSSSTALPSLVLPCLTRASALIRYMSANLKGMRQPCDMSEPMRLYLSLWVPSAENHAFLRMSLSANLR